MIEANEQLQAAVRENDAANFLRAARAWATGDESRATMEALTDASRDDEPVGCCVARILESALREREADAEIMDFLERTNVELRECGHPEGDPEWEVKVISGNRNDRWADYYRGTTVRKAVRAAIDAARQSHPGGKEGA